MTYQQTLDQSSHIVCHAGGPGVTGRQLDQSHQEVLALLDTFQGLLSFAVIRETEQHLLTIFDRFFRVEAFPSPVFSGMLRFYGYVENVASTLFENEKKLSNLLN